VVANRVLFLISDGRVSSIQRQLNLYGFRCTNRGEDKGVLFNPDFLRGVLDKARPRRRKKAILAGTPSPIPAGAASKDAGLMASAAVYAADDAAAVSLHNFSPRPQSLKRANSGSSFGDNEAEPQFKRTNYASASASDDGFEPMTMPDEEYEDVLFLSACRDIASTDFFEDVRNEAPDLQAQAKDVSYHGDGESYSDMDDSEFWANIIDGTLL
jgi:hypothetical protein